MCGSFGYQSETQDVSRAMAEASLLPAVRAAAPDDLIIADGTGEIECDGKTTQVGPGAVMYCAGNILHGITNTGKVPLTFYWSKWMARGF